MKVEIWTDISCPFCYLGQRRLEVASENTDVELEVIWHAFELNPRAPPYFEGTVEQHLIEKFGLEASEARKAIAIQTAEARELGLDFNLETAKPCNTFDAHRLIKLAQKHGVANDLVAMLFDAHFGQGVLISDKDKLKYIAELAGLPTDEIDEVLTTDKYTAEVREDETNAQSQGIFGVPYFIIDDETRISGAKQVEAFEQALLSRPSTSMDGPICTAEGCTPAPDGPMCTAEGCTISADGAVCTADGCTV